MGTPALLARIDLLHGEVRRARNVLTGQVLGECLDRAVKRDRMEHARADFVKELGMAQRWLDQDRQDVMQSVPLQTCWRAFEGHRGRVDHLLRESLAFVEGAVVRSLRIDDDFCTVADGLIAELDNAAGLRWSRFTLLADGESFSDLAEIIHVRFPAGRIWDLPVAAHEFGHFASGRLTARDAGGAGSYVPFEDLRAEGRVRAEQEGRDWTPADDSHLHEYYADAFAAFAIGPAYACTCLRLRFNPAAASASDHERHPPDAQRADLILAVLRLMAKQAKQEAGGVTGSYEGLLSRTHQFWEESVADASGGAPPGGGGHVPALARRLYDALDRRKELRFARWGQAQAMSAGLGGGRRPAELVTPHSSLIDVMNAAWLKRLGMPELDVDALSAEAMAVAHAILALRG
jgi:hypothetical protein